MQKVIRRTVLAEKQAARKLQRRRDKHAADRAKTAREQVRFSRMEETKDIKTARKVRREDWELGPLAPRRDVGDVKNTYGTIHTSRLRGEELDMKKRLEANPSGGRYPTIVKGDRVVLLEGHDKGRIGKISEIDFKRQECTVEGLNMVDIAVPKWMLIADGEEDQRPVRSFEKPVALSKIKLVIALPDPATGTVRDVIVRDIENGNVFCDRYTGARRWTRYIAGLGTKIPWPIVEPKEQKEYACDTLRMEVETQSFVPALLRPPMPSSVIDELRNKYSIFRTRHDEEYISKKMQEDAEKEEKKKLDKAMRTPLNEINKAERKKRKEKGKGKLTPEMLERIGAVITKRREALMEAAKTPEVQAALQA